jgi:hypothetical protein
MERVEGVVEAAGRGGHVVELLLGHVRTPG